MIKELIIYTDGGARGNPGPAAIGFVIYNKDREVIEQNGEYIGKNTNNYAEYMAVLKALEAAEKLKPEIIHFYLDSNLVVQQLNQRYKIKNEELGKLFIKIWNKRQSFKRVTFTHISRDKNKLADRLVNQALDKVLKGS